MEKETKFLGRPASPPEERATPEPYRGRNGVDWDAELKYIEKLDAEKAASTAGESHPAGPSKFKKKPVEVTALKFAVDGSNWKQVHQFMGVQCPTNVPTFYVLVQTLEGPLMAKRGDWIVRGIVGEFYPCKPDIFAATYEEVTND